MIKVRIDEAIWTASLIALGLLLGVLLSSDLLVDIDNIINFISPLAGAALGGYIAFVGIRRSQKIEKEEERVKVINRTIYILKNCLSGLCGYKKTYFYQIDGSPYRTLSISRFVGNLSPVSEDISDLQFLLPTSTDDFSFDLLKLDSSLRNYNLILKMIVRKDDDYAEFLSAAKKSGAVYNKETGFIDGEIASLINVIGEDQLDAIIIHGENLVKFIDDALIQLDESLKGIQLIAKKKIDFSLVPDAKIVNYLFTQESPYRYLIDNKLPALDQSLVESG